MDDIVAQALKKWPNVPHCHGWLALDARGNWRMRDQHTQDNNLPGDKIMHAALIAFIQRNVDCDAQGCWYFQNGPQRVYIDLALTPYIARTDPASGFALHTGAALAHIDQAWLSDAGCLLLGFTDGNGRKTAAALDDRDLAQCLPALRIDGAPLDNMGEMGEIRLMEWMAATDADTDTDTDRPTLTLQYQGQDIPVSHIAQPDIPQRFNFVSQPRP
ncbi:DUF2946 family protein [Oxalobacteraceae bacterium CAVE-383]|nr:DUF2946 family protein [Oxalobacteraceae bacterium CAVE-383]